MLRRLRLLKPIPITGKNQRGRALPSLFLILGLALLVLGILLFFRVQHDSSPDWVAKLDGKIITRDMIIAYAQDLPPSYRELLKTPDGFQKLVDFYIQRQLLLEHAKKSIPPDDPVLQNHLKIVPLEDAYIIAFVKKEVFDKIYVTDEEIAAYMKKKKISHLQMARALLIKEKKEKAYLQFVESLKKKHKLEYARDYF